MNFYIYGVTDFMTAPAALGICNTEKLFKSIYRVCS